MSKNHISNTNIQIKNYIDNSLDRDNAAANQFPEYIEQWQSKAYDTSSQLLIHINMAYDGDDVGESLIMTPRGDIVWYTPSWYDPFPEQINNSPAINAAWNYIIELYNSSLPGFKTLTLDQLRVYKSRRKDKLSQQQRIFKLKTLRGITNQILTANMISRLQDNIVKNITLKKMTLENESGVDRLSFNSLSVNLLIV